MFDILTIGHATIDYFLKIAQAEVTDADGEARKLCLDFAGKIPVEDFSKAVGGNAPNTAVGCARLGLTTAIVTWVGKDAEAEVVLQALKKEGVELFWINIAEGERTDESVILNFNGERTILAYHFPRTYALPEDPPPAKWVYLTSSGENFSDLHREVLAYIKGARAKLAYNPGVHELAAGSKANLEVLENCELLFLNLEEAREWIGKGDTISVEEALRDLAELGPKVAVVTDGANGSYGFESGKFFQTPVFKAKVVEMTGAGDAFAAGFLAAHIVGKDLDECLRWGNANAASVIGQIGSQAGLLNREGLKKFLSVSR